LANELIEQLNGQYAAQNNPNDPWNKALQGANPAGTSMTPMTGDNRPYGQGNMISEMMGNAPPPDRVVGGDQYIGGQGNVNYGKDQLGSLMDILNPGLGLNRGGGFGNTFGGGGGAEGKGMYSGSASPWDWGGGLMM
jgi:hypothetical protein